MNIELISSNVFRESEKVNLSGVIDYISEGDYQLITCKALAPGDIHSLKFKSFEHCVTAFIAIPIKGISDSKLFHDVKSEED